MVEFSIFEKLYDLNAHFRKYGNKHGYLLGTITIFFTIFPISFSTQSHDLVSPAAFKAIPPGATTQGSRSEGVTTPRVVDAVDASQIFPDLPRSSQMVLQKNSDWVLQGPPSHFPNAPSTLLARALVFTLRRELGDVVDAWWKMPIQNSMIFSF